MAAGAREIVLVSGVAELVCAAGLVHPRTRNAAGWASAALLLAVWPGNFQMAADSFDTDNTALQVGSVGAAAAADPDDPGRAQGRPRRVALLR